MRRSPTWRLVSLKVPEASTATYACSPLPMAVIAGNAAQTSREMPAKISFLRPFASIARTTRTSSNAFPEERAMISTPGSASTSSGNVGPHIQMDLPDHNGGSKNAVALYDFPQHVTYEFAADLPFRLSALRSLGAFGNVFAIESFMDELAELAGCDPIEFRLKHLADPRARKVVSRVAEISDYSTPCEAGFGRGFGFARFKNTGSYCAVVALVAVDETVEVQKLWAAVDAGLVINPAGVISQVEGGMLQAASWVLKEAVPTDGTRLIAESWKDYPILTFAETPETNVEIIADPDLPST